MQPTHIPPPLTPQWGVFFSRQTHYFIEMNILPTLHTGKMIIVTASHETREQITLLTAELAVRGAVTVLDGGNRFAAYQIVRMLRMRTSNIEEAAKRICVRRAFTCYQTLALLENSPSRPHPHIILDLLSSFYDENVPLPEVNRLLDRCLVQLDRLRMVAPVVISLTPHPDRAFLFERICSKGDQIIDVEIPFPIITQPALF
jgi:hypothetical protein